MISKGIAVTFGTLKIEKEFEELKNGKFEDKNLYTFIDRAITDLKKNPSCGTKISKHLWPKEYVTNYEIKNLWKYDLPNAWRLLYTIVGNEVKIVSVILDWMTHKEYDRKFHY